MNPNQQQQQLPHNGPAASPRRRSPPIQSPPGTLGPGMRTWRVDSNGHAQMIDRPASQTLQDGTYEYTGHVEPYQPTSEVIKTTTVRRVLRRTSQQVVDQAQVRPQVVQRTYTAPAVVEGQRVQYQQAQYPQALSSIPAMQQTQYQQVQHQQVQRQQPLPSAPIIEQVPYSQQTAASSLYAPMPQPVYQQHQQVLGQRAPLQRQHHSSHSTTTIQSTSPQPVTYQAQQSVSQNRVRPHIVTPVQTATFTAPAQMQSSSSSTRTTSYTAVQAPTLAQIASMQIATTTGQAQVQSSSSGMQTTSHRAVQTLPAPQAAVALQNTRQIQYASTQSQAQLQPESSGAYQVQHATLQTQLPPQCASMVQQPHVTPSGQSQSSVVTRTSTTAQKSGTVGSSRATHVQQRSLAVCASPADACGAVGTSTNALTRSQTHAVDYATAMLQQLGLSSAMQTGCSGSLMHAQCGMQVFSLAGCANGSFTPQHTGIAFQRRPEFAGSTSIAGYNTTKWGGALRQAAARQGPKPLATYDDEMSDHLAQVGRGVCPMNWRWYPVRQGYFCGGGNHLISHDEAESTMAGQRPQGPLVQLVNLEPVVPGRVVTPPPGPGDGNWEFKGNGIRDGRGSPGYYPLPKNSKGEWYDGWSYKKERGSMWYLKEEYKG